MTAVASDGLPPAAATRNPVLAVLQRIGRSLMLPIAVLPAAGLLLRLGQPDMLGKCAVEGPECSSGLAAHASWLVPVAKVLAAAGDSLFGALPLLFAIGVAIGFARKSDGSTALAGAVGYLVFDGVLKAIPVTAANAETGAAAVVVKPGVFGGIVIGITAALLYQRYYRIKLPPYLAFFGGRRFVPIVTAFSALILGVIFANLWTFPEAWIKDAGEWAVDNGTFGAGVFGLMNRALLPLGLHHVINSLAWFQLGDFNGVQGDLHRFFAGDPKAGTFMTGFFPIMMFGLPAAAVAMWQEARPDKRKLVGGIMLSAALTSFLTGVTEPLEFAFLFVAPALYAVHAVLTGVSLALMEALGVKDGFTFSAGFFDYALNYSKATRPLLIIVVGVIYAAVYYTVFRFAIRKWNLMTPGREPDEPGGTIDVTEPVPAAQRTSSPSGTQPAHP